MADTKISQLSAQAPAHANLVPHVHDPAGSPATRRATVLQLLKVLEGLSGGDRVGAAAFGHAAVVIDAGGDTGAPRVDPAGGGQLAADQAVIWINCPEEPDNAAPGDVWTQGLIARVDAAETAIANYGTMAMETAADYTRTSNLPVRVQDAGGDATVARLEVSTGVIVIWLNAPTLPDNLGPNDIWMGPSGYQHSIAVTGTSRMVMAADMGAILDCANGSAQAISLPLVASEDIPVGTVIAVERNGAGAVTVAIPAGGTINGVDNASVTVNSIAFFRHRAADQWVAYGDLA